ncbi:MAG: hypothetical protein LBN08_04570 [Lactobacillales bacterium]|jgi:hypothetical protein|nr:hypothetical protein [Lactobacillales bacterium]
MTKIKTKSEFSPIRDYQKVYGEYYYERKYFGEQIYYNKMTEAIAEYMRPWIKNKVICSTSAAALWGMPILDPIRDNRLIVINNKGHHSYKLCKCVECRKDLQIVERAGFFITSPLETLKKLAKITSLPSTVASINYSLHEGQITANDLNYPPLKRFKKYTNYKLESPLETKGYLYVMALGFERPELQIEIRDEHNRFVARVDMLWEKQKTIFELDGAEKMEMAENRDGYKKQQQREWKLRDMGYKIVRIMWHELSAGKLRDRLFDAGIPHQKIHELKSLAKHLADLENMV